MVSSKRKEYRMRSRVFNLVRQKELDERRVIKIAEMTKQTGLARNTIIAWLSDEPFARIDTHSALVLAKWLGVEWYELCEIVELETEN